MIRRKAATPDVLDGVLYYRKINGGRVRLNSQHCTARGARIKMSHIN